MFIRFDMIHEREKIAAMQKKPFSRTAAHIFVSPGDAPATITQYVASMERIQCLPHPSQHVPIYLQ